MPRAEGDSNTPLGQGSSSNPLSRTTGKARKSTKTTSTKQFSCKLCSSVFERRGHLEAHVETVHEGKKPHHCPHGCGKVFGHRSSLNRHIKSAHENSEMPPVRPPGRSQQQ